MVRTAEPAPAPSKVPRKGVRGLPAIVVVRKVVVIESQAKPRGRPPGKKKRPLVMEAQIR
jgi:hypothetical protein